MALGIYVVWRMDLGPKKLWIPIVVIWSFIIIRSLLDGMGDLSREARLATTSVLVYAMGRYYGMKIFQAFIPFVVIVCILVVTVTIYRFDDLGNMNTGSWWAPLNYTWLATFIGMAGTLSAYTITSAKWRYAYIGLITMGLLLTRAPVAFILIAFIFLVMFIKRDLNRNILIALGISGSCYLMFWFLVLGGGGNERLAHLFVNSEAWGPGRIPAYSSVINNISFFGHGFNRYGTELQSSVLVHQTPLVIIDMIGVIPALAWLYVTYHLTRNSQYQYVWAAVLAFCILGHFLWTFFGHWWWAIVGATSIVLYPIKEIEFIENSSDTKVVTIEQYSS